MMDMYVVHPMHNLKFIENIIVRPNIHLAMVACGIFIMISGTTLALNNRDEGPLEFYKRRLVRVLIPFYIAYIIYFIIRVINSKTIYIFGGVPKWKFIFTVLGLDEYLFANGIKTFTLGVGEWFLGCIILCYIAYPLLHFLNKKYRNIFFVIMTFYYLLINTKYDMFHFTIPSHLNFFCQVYNFYLGIFLSSYLSENNSEKKTSELILNVALLFVVIFIYFYAVIIKIPDNIKTTIFVVSIIFLLKNFEDIICKSEILKNGIKFFNSISLEIFLVHHFVIYQIDFMISYKRTSGVETLIIILLDFAITIILAIFVNRISCFMKKSHNERK